MEVLGAVFQHQPWEMSQPKGIFLDSCEEGREASAWASCTGFSDQGREEARLASTSGSLLRRVSGPS